MKKGGVLNNEGMYKKYMQHYIMLGGGGGLGSLVMERECLDTALKVMRNDN